MGTDGEPMIEIFLEECTDILVALSESIEKGKQAAGFDKELLDDIFREVHTIKADATMMLFENMAAPARALEEILYYYRDEVGYVTNFKAFLELISNCYHFFRDEFKKLVEGGTSDGDSRELTKQIFQYRFILTGKKPEEEDVNKKVCFSSAASDSKESEIISGSDPSAVVQNHAKHILIPSEEIDILDNIHGRFLKNFQNVDNDEVQSLILELDNWLWRIHSADFKLMAEKLDMTIKDMLHHIDKQVEFSATGTELTIEKSRLEKISNAAIHLIRNAVDHGIEFPQERRMAGKPSCGHINMDIHLLEDHSGIRIRISDDGRGINMFEILDKAAEKGLLTKPYELYTEAEAIALIFEPGFTTREEVGEYSGRGVGMDAVRHNLMEVGGMVQIESVYGIGTTVIMEIVYLMSDIQKDVEAKKNDLIDESVNSRR